MDSTFEGRQPQDDTWDEFKVSSMESIFPLMSGRGKKGNSIYLDRDP